MAGGLRQDRHMRCRSLARSGIRLFHDNPTWTDNDLPQLGVSQM